MSHLQTITYAAQVAYVGKCYSGWQRQNEALGIQEVLEKALTYLSLSPVSVVGAGRTDKGVHAIGQVVSFRMDKKWEEDRLMIAINFYLPEDVRVMRIWSVPEHFHARRSALWREYRYFIWHGKTCLPHLYDYMWWRKVPWDEKLARSACSLLEGYHDFCAFCKTGECPEDSYRTLSRVKYKRMGNISMLLVRAPSFLMNMVRIIVGNVDRVACGKESLSWLEGLLQGRSRASSAMTAPAGGLYFWRAAYKDFISGWARAPFWGGGM